MPNRVSSTGTQGNGLTGDWITLASASLSSIELSGEPSGVVIPGVRIDLRYATTNNFIGKNIYGDFRKAMLRGEVAEMLAQAARNLLAAQPTWSLLLLDAYRPQAAQHELWSHVVGTPNQIYVADPAKGSIHSYGCAVDLTLCDSNGAEIDMGTGFDEFHERSQPRYEERFLASGELKREHYENRLVLRHAMTSAGFSQLAYEWWHFDAYAPEYVRRNFQIGE